MKKSILILGPAGSGKTKMQTQLLSEYAKCDVRTMLYSDIVLGIDKVKFDFFERYKVVVIEEVYTSTGIEFVHEWLKEGGFYIITTQLPMKQIPEYLIGDFEIIDLN